MPQNIQIDPAILDSRPPEYDLSLRRRFFPSGYPLDLETNSRDVLEAAQEGWGQFAPVFEATPARFALVVTDGDAMPPALKSVFLVREHLMSVVSDAENFVMCDFSCGVAAGQVTRAVAADHPLLRYRFLAAAGSTLVEQLALAPLHGALIVRNGRGVMLCGESFAGKSTVAYACARTGWIFVSDDAVSLVRNRSDRYALGDPYTMRFRDDARALFPELADRLAVVRPNGKISIELFTRDLPIETSTGWSIDYVVFLNRQECVAPYLRPYPKHHAVETWGDVHACLGTTRVRAAQRQCYRRLLETSMWELTYSHFDDAVARLEQLVDSGA